MEIKDVGVFEILSLLPGSIYWKDKHGVYQGANEEAIKLAGLNFIQDIVGKTDYDLFTKEQADAFRENDLKVMKSRQEHTIEEVSYLPDGKRLIQLSTKKPMLDPKGNVIGILGNTIDITYLKNIETELIEAKERAEAADKLKSAFINNMEHDLRTPFWGLIGMAEELEETENDPEKRKCAETIKNSANQLLEYCTSILEFSKTEAGVYPLLAKKFNLREMIEKIVSMETPAAKVKKLSFAAEVTDDIPEILIGDQNRLQRILLNLVGNAIKFTKAGFVKIKVHLAKSESEKRILLYFFVEDSGMGISEEIQPIIFEKFVRGTPSNMEMYKGFGLGLRTVKQLVEEMEGEIDVKSKEGSGTTFVCTLPFQVPLLEVDPLNNEPLRVLLIEADSKIQTRQIMVLEYYNCTVNVAATGKEAMELFASNRYDIIFVCVKLPDIDGITLIRALREKTSLPIIAIASMDEQSEQDKLLQAGANEFIAKPVEGRCEKILTKYIPRFKNIT